MRVLQIKMRDHIVLAVKGIYDGQKSETTNQVIQKIILTIS